MSSNQVGREGSQTGMEEKGVRSVEKGGKPNQVGKGEVLKQIRLEIICKS